MFVPLAVEHVDCALFHYVFLWIMPYDSTSIIPLEFLDFLQFCSVGFS